MQYCCQAMQRCVEHREFVYDKARGCFMCYANDEDWGGAGSYSLKACQYCPFCGAKLPKDRQAIDGTGPRPYIDALEEAVGKEFCDIKPEEIPEEFKTDEWWKKRGL